jgi:hypothetical protein
MKDHRGPTGPQRAFETLIGSSRFCPAGRCGSPALADRRRPPWLEEFLEHPPGSPPSESPEASLDVTPRHGDRWKQHHPWRSLEDLLLRLDRGRLDLRLQARRARRVPVCLSARAQTSRTRTPQAARRGDRLGGQCRPDSGDLPLQRADSLNLTPEAGRPRRDRPHRRPTSILAPRRPP